LRIKSIRDFDGVLTHKNPDCERCKQRCYALYFGGKKGRVVDAYVCEKCELVYLLPLRKKCEFQGGNRFD